MYTPGPLDWIHGDQFVCKSKAGRRPFDRNTFMTLTKRFWKTFTPFGLMDASSIVYFGEEVDGSPKCCL